MAHNLNSENGKVAYYGVGELPWHKLGQTVNLPVSDLEAQKLAGLDWDAVKTPLYRSDMEEVPSHFAITRSDNSKTLGVVTKHYQPVQNKELFEWLRGLDGYADVQIETAGALGMGETVWVLGRCKGLTFDIGGDEHQGYLAVINGHAGNRRLQIVPTGVRVVCQNTLQMAAGAGVADEAPGRKASKEFVGTLSTGFQLRHTKNIQEMMESIQTAYAKTTVAWKSTEMAMRHLAAKPLTDEAIAKLFSEPFIQPKAVNKDLEALNAFINDEEVEEVEDESVRAAAIRAAREKRLNEILASETCTRFQATRGTLFAAFNAVTQYVDHEAPVRTSTGTVEAQEMARFASANFSGGNGDKVKRKAYRLAVELATA